MKVTEEQSICALGQHKSEQLVIYKKIAYKGRYPDDHAFHDLIHYTLQMNILELLNKTRKQWLEGAPQATKSF